MVVVYSYGCLVVTSLNNRGTPINRGQIPSEMSSKTNIVIIHKMYI